MINRIITIITLVLALWIILSIWLPRAQSAPTMLRATLVTTPTATPYHSTRVDDWYYQSRLPLVLR